MAEIKTILYRKPLKYEGLFRTDELYRTIMRFCNERSYWMVESRSEEKLISTGKDVFIEMRPYRKYSDYLKGEIVVEMHLQGVKDKTVEVAGHKQKYQSGTVTIRFSVNLLSDWRGRWEGTGLMFFLRTMMDKFVRHDLFHQAEEKALVDQAAMQEEIRAYLNMTKFSFAPKQKAGEPRKNVIDEEFEAGKLIPPS